MAGRSGRSIGRSVAAVTAVRWAGKIVPVEVTVRLLKKAMDESGKTKFLIDGFPRNMNNVDVRPNSDSYYKSTGTHSLRLRSLPACLPACRTG